MSFDELMRAHGVAVVPVDRFAGLVVEVGVPTDWEPFDSELGMRVWLCSSDPLIRQFCANAVLTMHRLEAPLDEAEVFAMLTEQQMHMVPGSRELHREFSAATEGIGSVGALFMQIDDELGTIDSVSRSRIITIEQETLIAQLTVTALHESSVDRAHVGLTVRTGAGASPTSAGHVGGAAVTQTADDR